MYSSTDLCSTLPSTTSEEMFHVISLPSPHNHRPPRLLFVGIRVPTCQPKWYVLFFLCGVRRGDKCHVPPDIRDIPIGYWGVFPGSRLDSLRDLPGLRGRLLRQAPVSGERRTSYVDGFMYCSLISLRVCADRRDGCLKAVLAINKCQPAVGASI